MLEVFLLMLSASVQSVGTIGAAAPPIAAHAAQAMPTEVAQAPISDEAPENAVLKGEEIAVDKDTPSDEDTAAAAPEETVTEPENGTSETPSASDAPEDSSGFDAEPQIASGRFLTALEVRPILNATRGNWISVREFGGQDLLYISHLWAWRCGLHEIRIGLNGATPEVWPMPDCHTDQPAPAAILEGDGLPYRAFPRRSVQIIEVHLLFDDLSRTELRFNRAGIVIP